LKKALLLAASILFSVSAFAGLKATSSLDVSDTNSSFTIQDGTLPINSGFGPQVTQTLLWNKAKVSGFTGGSLNIVNSTTPLTTTSGGAPYIPAPGSAFTLGSGVLTLQTYDYNNPFGTTIFSFDSSGLTFPDSSVQTTAATPYTLSVSTIGVQHPNGVIDVYSSTGEETTNGDLLKTTINFVAQCADTILLGATTYDLQGSTVDLTLNNTCSTGVSLFGQGSDRTIIKSSATASVALIIRAGNNTLTKGIQVQPKRTDNVTQVAWGSNVNISNATLEDFYVNGGGADGIWFFNASQTASNIIVKRYRSLTAFDSINFSPGNGGSLYVYDSDLNETTNSTWPNFARGIVWGGNGTIVNLWNTNATQTNTGGNIARGADCGVVPSGGLATLNWYSGKITNSGGTVNGINIVPGFGKSAVANITSQLIHDPTTDSTSAGGGGSIAQINYVDSTMTVTSLATLNNASASTFLRGDKTWAVPAGGDNLGTHISTKTITAGFGITASSEIIQSSVTIGGVLTSTGPYSTLSGSVSVSGILAGSTVTAGTFQLPRGPFDVQGSTTLIDGPATGSATQDNGAYHYHNDGYSYQYLVYAYKTVDGIKLYSATPQLIDFSDDGFGTDFYRILISWSSVPGAEGYLVLLNENDYDGTGVFSDGIWRYKDNGLSTSITDNGALSAFPSTGPISLITSMSAEWKASNNGYLYSFNNNLKLGANYDYTPGGVYVPTVRLSNADRLTILETNSDQYAGSAGGVSLTLTNEDYHNGALFTNKSLDLIDFQFASLHTTFGSGNNLFLTLRWEGRTPYIRDKRNSARGEIQIGSTVDGDGDPSFTVGDQAITIQRSSLSLVPLGGNGLVYTVAGGTLTTSANALFDGTTSTFTATYATTMAVDPSYTLAQIKALTPYKVGAHIYCSDCATDDMVISTGTGKGAWARPGARTTPPN
jgi:hypothetical protein